MIRFEIALLALALGVTSVACGGSQAPAKDPSSDAAATEPTAPETASKPPPPPAETPDYRAPSPNASRTVVNVIIAAIAAFFLWLASLST